jgi:lipid-A-disaccharide synthase
MDEEIVKELIQHDCNAKMIENELKQIVIGGNKRELMLSKYAEMAEILGGGGASKKVAHSLLKTIR